MLAGALDPLVTRMTTEKVTLSKIPTCSRPGFRGGRRGGHICPYLSNVKLMHLEGNAEYFARPIPLFSPWTCPLISSFSGHLYVNTSGMPFFLPFQDFRIFHQSSVKMKFDFLTLISLFLHLRVFLQRL